MTNNITKLVESQKKYLVRLTGDVSEPRGLKIDAGALAFALNLNSKVMGIATDRKAQYRLYLKSITYDVQSGDPNGYIILSSDGDAGINTIITLSKADHKDFNQGGEPYVIPAAAANSTGNIFLQTIGFQGNSAYTIIADFRKDARDYDQGQTADPVAFNSGHGLAKF